MAKIKQTVDKFTAGVEKARLALEAAQYSPANADLFNNKQTASFIGLESLNDAQRVEFDAHLQTAESVLDTIIPSLESISGDKLEEHQIDAGKILLAAAADPMAYIKAQQTVRSDKGGHSMNLEGLFHGEFGSLDIAQSQDFAMFSLESFDEKELNKFLNYSIIFNVLASRQDEFNSGFFKPLTITPDEVGYRVAVRVEQIWDGLEHNPNGDVAEVLKRNLIDALIEPEVLATNSTLVIPYFQEGSISSKEHFVDAAAVPLTVEMLDNIPVKTSYLKVDMEHSLLGLSSHPALISAELMSDKDSLDSRAALSNVLVKVGEKYVDFDTNMLHTAGFYKSVEGNMREMTLSFRNKSFVAGDKVKAVDGSDVPAFKALTDAKYDVRIELRLNGQLRADTSFVELNKSPVKIAAVYKDGKKVPHDKVGLEADATLKGLLDPILKAEIVGYKLEARRTNFNLRTRGRMIDSTEHFEQVTVPLRSPISIVKPAVGGDKEHPDVGALVRAARIQANNDGVLTVLNLGRLLSQITSRENYSLEADRESFPGIGRHFINPCYIYAQWHLPTMINSVQSSNRLEDIQGAIATSINELVGRVMKETNYIAVVETMTGGNPGEVEVVIGTDYRLPPYIMTKGDTRLFGGGISYNIYRSPNKHMRNKILITLSRKNGEAGPDPFTFGTFVWTSELMVSQTLTRMNSTYINHMVQPRYLHAVNLPILIEIDVTGLEEVTSEATVLPTLAVTTEADKETGNDRVIPAPTASSPTTTRSGKPAS